MENCLVADIFTKAKRSSLMAAVRWRGNRSTELRLRNALMHFGVNGWRRHYKIVGTPDFAFPKLKIAVFVDGCFWHGCPMCGTIPSTNRDFWVVKIDRNKARDIEQTKALKSKGWTVLRIWEHELKSASIASVIRRVKAAKTRKIKVLSGRE